MTIQSYTDLRVWQAAIELVEDVYLLTGSFPKDEQYGLTSQMRRAAVSIPSNIAEGHGRRHLKEYLDHLSMAQGSLAELHTQVVIGCRLQYCAEERANPVLERITMVGTQFHALRNSLSNKG